MSCFIRLWEPHSTDYGCLVLFLAVIGPALPDFLEPAKHWTHRKKFHRKKTLRLSEWIFAPTAVLGLFTPVFTYISCFFLGYMLHLLADSMTRAGLPGN